MKTLGLTGGIASGKSTVSEYFRDLGAFVIDADLIVHELYARDETLRKTLIESFGQEILDLQTGQINRPILGNLIFNNSILKKKLESIIHPLVRQKMRHKIEEAKAQKYALCLVDAALLVETGMYKDFDGLITVNATSEQQIERLMIRNGLSREACLARLSSQMPNEEKIKHADWIIDNTQSLSDTRKQVELLYKKLIKSP